MTILHFGEHRINDNINDSIEYQILEADGLKLKWYFELDILIYFIEIRFSCREIYRLLINYWGKL